MSDTIWALDKIDEVIEEHDGSPSALMTDTGSNRGSCARRRLMSSRSPPGRHRRSTIQTPEPTTSNRMWHRAEGP